MLLYKLGLLQVHVEVFLFELLTDKIKYEIAINRATLKLYIAVYFRQGGGKFGPEQVDPALCTHIIYTWAHLDEHNYNLVPGNPELDVDNGW